MTEIPEMNPLPGNTPKPTQGAAQSDVTQDTSSKPFNATQGDGWESFRKFLGKENFDKFQKVLCQSIATQIQSDTKRMKKALENAREAQKGEGPLG